MRLLHVSIPVWLRRKSLCLSGSAGVWFEELARKRAPFRWTVLQVGMHIKVLGPPKPREVITHYGYPRHTSS